MRTSQHSPLHIQAFAKLNLGLRVLGRRADGYHEIETLLQSIDLCDTLTLTIPEQPGIELKIASPWPLPERENLVYRAAELVAAKVGLPQGVHIFLEKRIPVGAGLGGGSSDAAAALVGLNKLFQLNLNQADLHQMACALGSDVPYFLLGGLCHGRERGEILQKLAPAFDDLTFVLLTPDFSLSTEAVYREFDLLVAQGLHPRSLHLSGHGRGNPLWLPLGRHGGLPRGVHNDLEDAALRLRPELSECRRVLAELEPAMLGLSGSGPTYYTAWEFAAEAEQVAQKLQQPGYTVCLARLTDRGYQFVE